MSHNIVLLYCLVPQPFCFMRYPYSSSFLFLYSQAHVLFLDSYIHCLSILAFLFHAKTHTLDLGHVILVFHITGNSQS